MAYGVELCHTPVTATPTTFLSAVFSIQSSRYRISYHNNLDNQEYVKLVRKQFRHWRKQGSPSPYRDKSALPEAHWDRDSTRTPTAPWQAGSTDSVKAEANVRVFTGAVYRTAREGEGQEGGGIVRPRSGTQEVSGIVELPGKEERGEAAMEPARGVQAKQQSGR